jgi:hypothetical protein
VNDWDPNDEVNHWTKDRLWASLLVLAICELVLAYRALWVETMFGLLMRLCLAAGEC